MFVVVIAFLGCLNYALDQMFRQLILSMPQLALPYVFQYHFILPLIDAAFLLTVFHGIRFLKVRRKNGCHSFK